MNTMNPDSPSAFGGHHDDDKATRPIHTGPVGSAQTRPEQQLYAPLPYGTGFSTPQPLGFGVGPSDVGPTASGSTGKAIEVAERKHAGSPILALAGLLSMAVAVWAILGAPVITPTILLAAGLVLAVLVGLVMVIRR